MSALDNMVLCSKEGPYGLISSLVARFIPKNMPQELLKHYVILVYSILLKPREKGDGFPIFCEAAMYSYSLKVNREFRKSEQFVTCLNTLFDCHNEISIQVLRLLIHLKRVPCFGRQTSDLFPLSLDENDLDPNPVRSTEASDFFNMQTLFDDSQFNLQTNRISFHLDSSLDVFGNQKLLDLHNEMAACDKNIDEGYESPTSETMKYNCDHQVKCTPSQKVCDFSTLNKHILFYMFLSHKLQTAPLFGNTNNLRFFACSETNLIKYSKDAMLGIYPNIILLSEKIGFDLIVKTCSPATARSIINDFIQWGNSYSMLETFSQDSYSKGQVMESFATTLMQYLRCYQHLILFSKPNLSLLELRSFMLNSGRQLNLVANFLDPKLIGLSFITHLNNLYSECIDRKMKAVWWLFLKNSIQPYLRFLENWIIFGTCVDPYDEFGIKVNGEALSCRNRQYWTHGFGLDNSLNIPTFLSDIKEDILSCGKSVNLLKICSPQHSIFSHQNSMSIPFNLTLFYDDLNKIQVDALNYEHSAIRLYPNNYKSFKQILSEREQIHQFTHCSSTSKKLEEIKNEQITLKMRKRLLKQEHFQSLKKEMEHVMNVRKEREKSILQQDVLWESLKEEYLADKEKLKDDIKNEMKVKYHCLNKEMDFKHLKYDWKLKRAKINKKRLNFFHSVIDSDVMNEQLEEINLSRSTDKLSCTPEATTTNELSPSLFQRSDVNANVSHLEVKSKEILKSPNVALYSTSLGINENSNTIRSGDENMNITLPHCPNSIIPRPYDSNFNPIEVKEPVRECKSTPLYLNNISGNAKAGTSLARIYSENEQRRHSNKKKIMGHNFNSENYLTASTDIENARHDYYQQSSVTLLLPHMADLKSPVDHIKLCSSSDSNITSNCIVSTCPSNEEIENEISDYEESLNLSTKVTMTFEDLIRKCTSDNILSDIYENDVPTRYNIQKTLEGLKFSDHDVFKSALTTPLKTQSRLVNAALLNHLLCDCDFLGHLSALRNFLLLYDGEFGSTLIKEVHLKLDEVKSPSEFLNPVILTNILDKALKASLMGQSKYAENIGFYVKNSEAILNKSSIKVFNYFGLTYCLKWPLNIIVTDSCLDIYNTILSFLLQVHNTLLSLQEAFNCLRKCNDNKCKKIMDLYLHCYLMQAFARTLLGYSCDQILFLTWFEFQNHLKNRVFSLEDLYQAHARYLNNAMFRCLLNKKANRVLNYIIRTLSVILKFCHVLCSSGVDENYSSTCFDSVYVNLKQHFIVFHQTACYVFKLITKLRKHGYGQHFEDLLIRMDCNHFYTKNSD